MPTLVRAPVPSWREAASSSNSTWCSRASTQRVNASRSDLPNSQTFTFAYPAPFAASNLPSIGLVLRAGRIRQR